MSAAAPVPAGRSATCFCRDCLGELDFAARRCSECRSPRLVRHRALASLTLAHIDCDAFYATVEKRDNPELADKPVIIGGGKRGVVSAACYISRTPGVRSACADVRKRSRAVPVRSRDPAGNMAKYVRVGREVRHAMQALTPLVEPLSLDEAFLDLSWHPARSRPDPRQSSRPLRPRGRARHRHHGFRRAVVQQVSGQDRLRPRQAARFCCARPGRSARDAG